MLERAERVLLVVDGDNLEITLRYLRGRLDWTELRRVVPYACHQLQQPRMSFTTVGPVTEAHYFFTLPFQEDEGETNNALQRYRTRSRAIRDAGYVPHLYFKTRDDEGNIRDYHDDEISNLIRERMDDFDTLIIVSSDHGFWPLAQEFYEQRTRSFIVCSETSTSDRKRRDAKLPFVEVTKLMIFNSSTILPMYRRIIAPARVEKIPA